MGAFSPNLVREGEFAQPQKKNITFLENDIGFKKQIGWNCNKYKKRNKRHAIEGSMEKPKAYFNSVHFLAQLKVCHFPLTFCF